MIRAVTVKIKCKSSVTFHRNPLYYRSVRGFHFDRAAASVLTTCLSVLEERFLFLGSRLGNSLLLQFTEKELHLDRQWLGRRGEVWPSFTLDPESVHRLHI